MKEYGKFFNQIFYKICLLNTVESDEYNFLLESTFYEMNSFKNFLNNISTYYDELLKKHFPFIYNNKDIFNLELFQHLSMVCVNYSIQLSLEIVDFINEILPDSFIIRPSLFKLSQIKEYLILLKKKNVIAK